MPKGRNSLKHETAQGTVPLFESQWGNKNRELRLCVEHLRIIERTVKANATGRQQFKRE